MSINDRVLEIRHRSVHTSATSRFSGQWQLRASLGLSRSGTLPPLAGQRSALRLQTQHTCPNASIETGQENGMCREGRAHNRPDDQQA